jgi:hypothetical protein
MSLKGMTAKFFNKWLADKGYARLGEIPIEKYDELVQEFKDQLQIEKEGV